MNTLILPVVGTVKTKGGDLVDEGTYFYMIKAELESGEELTKQGFVQVYH